MKNSISRFISLLLLLSAGLLNAQQWQRVEALPAVELTALFAKGDTLFAAAANKLYFTWDAGKSWDSTAVIHPDLDFIEDIYYGQGRLFVGTTIAGVFRSSDRGQSWQADNAGLAGAALSISSLAVRGDSLYAGTYGEGVFVKKISANSFWSAYNTGMPWFNIFSLSNVDGKLYAGAGGNATCTRQASPGHSWTETPFAAFNGSMNALLGVVRHKDALLAAGTLGLYRSVDEGANWIPYNPGAGVLGSARLLVDGDRVIANLAKPAGFSFIKISTDNGLSWQDFTPAISGSFGHDIALLGGALYSARSNGLWRIGGSTPVRELLGHDAALLQNFPNPFSRATTIPVTLHSGGYIDLSIFDAQGRPVETLLKGEYPAGDYRLEFRADGLPAGIYYARLSTPAAVLSRRLIFAGAH